MRALVLSGGSIKGAFQAGAVDYLLRAGYRPDIITGISVGSLNGGYLVSRATRAARASGGAVDWPAVGAELVRFWRERITGPDVLLQRRGVFDLALRLVGKNWGGLVSMDRLYALVRSELSADDFRDPPVRSGFGAVSLDTGRIVYAPADPGTADQVVEYIVASTQEPVTMPLFEVGGEWFYDGGVRDLAPLKQAIRLGATEIVCVACQPADVGPLGAGFNRGDPMALVGRVLEIVENELLNGDLETLVETNRLLVEAGEVRALKGKRVIPLLVVRPAEKIEVEVTGFGPGDIERMVGLGAERAGEVVGRARGDRGDPGYPVAVGLEGAAMVRVRPAA